MSERAARATTCARCDAEIDACACCDEPECGAPLCYACMNLLVRQATPQRDDDSD